MSKRLALFAAALLGSAAFGAGSVQLQSIPDAFARLGHSCGGIQQQIFGEGFDANGNVTGFVYAQARCGGSGRYSHTTTYSTWVAVTWDLGGYVVDEVPQVPDPDPSIAGAAHTGSRVGGANYPTCNNTSPDDNAFSCFSNPVIDSTGAYSVQTSLFVTNQAACTASNTTYCTYRGILTTP